MADGNTDRRQEIESLLAERKRYEAWLAQLESRRAAAPAHVHARVHADYRARLDAVRGKLAAETGAIEEIVRELGARLASEQAAVVARTDERAEAELRAAVGEFTEKEWNSRRKKLDDAIGELRATFDATERELATLKDLLRSVSGAPAPPRPSLEQAAITRVTGDLAVAGSADPGAPAAGVPAVEAAAGEERASVEAVGFVEEVVTIEDVATVETASALAAAGVPDSGHDTGIVDSPSPMSAVESDAGNGAAPGAVEDPDPARPAAFDELAFLRSVAGTPSSPRGAKAVSEGPSRPARRESRAGAKGEAAGQPAPPAPPDAPEEAAPSPGVLGGPTPRTSQAIRSLKCQECGTLNFPTEWYCERCGGELAAF